MKTLDLNTLPIYAWRPPKPTLGRTSNRVSERELERVPVTISSPIGCDPKTKWEIPVRLWDYSSFGFAVVCRPSKFGPMQLEVGDSIRLNVNFGEGPLTSECVVKNLIPFRDGLRVGLGRRDLTRIIDPKKEFGPPKGEYHRIPESVGIRAEARNPAIYGEWCAMEISGLRTGLCVEFTCSDSAMPFFMGQVLDVRMALPTTGANTYLGKIISLERVRGSTLRILSRPVSISAGAANDLAEMLAFEAGISPDTLKRLGFPTRFFRNRIEFRFVENMEDYAKVLNLRRNAYIDAGKKSHDTNPEGMSIPWDKRSRILCAFHEDILVASAAITFPESDADILRSEMGFLDNAYPVSHPKKTKLMEVNSLCTHREYRRGDLLQSVFQQIARIFILSDRICIMNLVETALLPLYLGIGFHDTGHTCFFLGREHHLIQVSRRAITHGKGMSLIRWNILYGALMKDALQKRALPFTRWEKLILQARLAFKPFSEKWLHAKLEEAFRKSILNRGEVES